MSSNRPSDDARHAGPPARVFQAAEPRLGRLQICSVIALRHSYRFESETSSAERLSGWLSLSANGLEHPSRVPPIRATGRPQVRANAGFWTLALYDRSLSAGAPRFRGGATQSRPTYQAVFTGSAGRSFCDRRFRWPSCCMITRRKEAAVKPGLCGPVHVLRSTFGNGTGRISCSDLYLHATAIVTSACGAAWPLSMLAPRWAFVGHWRRPERPSFTYWPTRSIVRCNT